MGAVTGIQLTPPKTVGAVVRQARDALRRYRQDTAAARPQQPQQPQQLQEQVQPSQQQQQQVQRPNYQGSARLTMQLPYPVASMSAGLPLMDQSFYLFDEGDWPGGIVQRFRALRPLVEATLEGYDPQFLGMLESPADGLGCWSLPDTTLCGITTNATFPSFAKLCNGGYGSRPLQPGHTIIAVNPEWTGPKDIGQFWERQLKQTAEELLAPDQWRVLYSCKMVRTSRGKGHGLLVGSYGLGWYLWGAASEESSSVRESPCLLFSKEKPEQSTIVEAINKAAAAGTG